MKRAERVETVDLCSEEAESPRPTKRPRALEVVDLTDEGDLGAGQ